MPRYDYQREDGTVFEVTHSIHDDPLTECPETGQPCKRIIGSPLFNFKGEGFHCIDKRMDKGEVPIRYQ